MAKLVISSSTDERPNDFWQFYPEAPTGPTLNELLRRLPETNRLVGDLYEAIEGHFGTRMAQCAVKIYDGKGWCTGGGQRCCDVDYVITGPADMLRVLVADAEFRAEHIGDDLTAEDIAEIVQGIGD